MAIKYAIRKKKFKDAEGETQELYFATAHRMDIIKTDEIAKLIQEATSLNEADIYGALKALSQVLARQLKSGKSVKLDGVGTFSLSLTSKPSSTAANVPHKSVKVNKVCFKADRKLSEEVKNVEVQKLGTL
ncbi:MAG: HU family DNA-binding protein [Bacteroidales bacterium]|jgi:predicted histone-like DNA-binding protein|nr:HU family DNA-binding protein [Bacteroidales bacterium]